MINNQSKQSNPIKIRRTVDQLESYDLVNNTWSKLILAGFNDTGTGEYSYKFNETYNTLNNLDNPFLNDLMDKVVGKNIGSNSSYNPMQMNFKRTYLPVTGLVLADQPDTQESIVANSTETYENNVLYFLPIKDLNINVTSLPTVNITYNVNNQLNTEQTGTYFPIVENLSTGKIGNTGRVTAIVAHHVASYNVNITPTVTISGGGLSSPVIIPAAKIRIRKRSIRSVNIENKGYGYKVTASNHGFANYVSQNEKYYYSMYDTADRDNQSTIQPTIVSRIRTAQNIVTNNGTSGIDGGFDVYSNKSQTFLIKERNELFDAFILDGGEYMPSNDYIDKGVRSTRFDSSNGYDQYINGTAYNYDFDGFKGYESSNKQVRNTTKSYSTEDMRASYDSAKKYAIMPLYNFFYSFQPYNSGGFTTSSQEKIDSTRRYRADFKTSVMRELKKLNYATGDDQVLVMLGNESNLDYMLQGFDYSTGSPTFGQNIYWADPANPLNLQKNVEAMIAFFNDFIGEIKGNFGNKFVLGIGLQYADLGRCVQVETAMNLGLTNNADFIGNNYYGNQTTTTPYVNKAGLNVFTRYSTNVLTANRLPMIITEAGSPSMIYNAGGANPTNYEVQQGDIMKNMLKTLNLYSFVNGVALFGFWNQANRGYEFLQADYDGFNFPAIAPVTQTFFNERDMGIFKFPLLNPTGVEDNYTNIPTAAEMTTFAKPSFTAIKTEVATNYTNLTKII